MPSFHSDTIFLKNQETESIQCVPKENMSWIKTSLSASLLRMKVYQTFLVWWPSTSIQWTTISRNDSGHSKHATNSPHLDCIFPKIWLYNLLPSKVFCSVTTYFFYCWPNFPIKFMLAFWFPYQLLVNTMQVT